MYEVIERILIDEETIRQRCKELGKQISEDYRNANEVPYVVGLLRGSVPFMAELIKNIDLEIQIDFCSMNMYYSQFG